ncbi:crotonase/enoyl-CoA hydratase family protein [Novosphingobium sp. Gsoil 351]|uniref:crotonase/enoyl-CoA hydratase family protein n=1 Tax=Novosphingobium sp. Gsoil 351 TaxID=2675225 RepID=UPI0012B45815|nr:crotonase/enoyl-CoA hydratase family protein [Novosphingobium sp. Gsoil 351]QGN53217.1 enoyl-CoA hydratase [Novosphingobium sp. Gsoil 351]
MDRLVADLDNERRFATSEDTQSLFFEHADADFAHVSRQRLALPEKLFRLNELEVLYEPADEILWTFMQPAGRPSFTPPMLEDFEDWQRLILSGFGEGRTPLKYLVLGSRAPGVFCFGGDLDLFNRLIRSGDRAGLVRYGYRCVEILHRNINALDLPILTIGLVQGAALGGGFEALLSFDHVIAERSATFGLPETMFGLFPGMGAHAMLYRKLGSAVADRIILSNKTYSAQEMYDLGIVHEVVEDGAGIAATRAFFAKNARRHAGLVGAKRAMRESCHVSLAELKRIVDHWAESALQLREQDLKLMQRLASAQSRLVARTG